MTDLAGLHLLLLDADTEPSDAFALISNLHPSLPGPDAEGARRLTRHTTVLGPIPVTAELAQELGLDGTDDGAAGLDGETAGSFAHVIAVRGPRDREGAPPPDWFRDDDGLWELFPHGLPERAEERNIDMLIAVARRLHASVRLADEPGLPTPRILTPDPQARIMMTVYSPYWLAPEVLEDRLRQVSAGIARPDIDEMLLRAAGDDPVMLDGYALETAVPGSAAGGLLEVGVMVEESLPAIVRAHVAGPQIAYQVRWIQTDEIRSLPAVSYRTERERAAVEIERIAAATMRAVAGIGVDESGFLVADSQLG